MKNITIIITIVFTSIITFGFNQSMTISHAGISPNDELTVNIGDSIEFIHGGGGSHPMTEGWNSGEESTPIIFETQTVTSAMPSVTFSLNTVGTYYFHCGTNPNNQDNWGKIIVVDSTTIEPEDTTETTTAIVESYKLTFNIYPNPVTNILHIEGLENEAIVYDLNGKKIMTIVETTTDLSLLPLGKYYLKSNNLIHKFVKK